MAREVVIVEAVRTPIGKRGGILSGTFVGECPVPHPLRARGR